MPFTVKVKDFRRCGLGKTNCGLGKGRRWQIIDAIWQCYAGETCDGHLGWTVGSSVAAQSSGKCGLEGQT